MKVSVYELLYSTCKDELTSGNRLADIEITGKQATNEEIVNPVSVMKPTTCHMNISVQVI